MEFRTPRQENLKSFKSTVKRTTFEKLDFSRFLKGKKFQKNKLFEKRVFFSENFAIMKTHFSKS